MKKIIVFCGFILFGIQSMAQSDDKQRDINKISLVEELMLTFTDDYTLIELVNSSARKDSLLRVEIDRRLPAILTDEELYLEMKNN